MERPHAEAEPAYDFLIIGGGLAGLAAGVRAAELGLRTLILEQGDGEDYPCNSRYSGGVLHVGFHDPHRPPQELTKIIMQLTDDAARPALAAALAENAPRLIAWLRGKDTRFMRFTQHEGYHWGIAPPRALRAGEDWKKRGPDLLLRRLAREFVAMGGTLNLRCRAKNLIVKDGRCVGARTQRDGREESWLATHCLIADGGFQADRELFESHIGPDFDAVFQRNAGTGRGDGLRMAAEIGAQITEAGRFYGHLLCSDVRHNRQLWPYPQLDAIATAGIVVGADGRRVADEGRGGVHLCNTLAGRPAQGALFAIFDHAIWEETGTKAWIPPNPLLEKAGGTVYRADSLAALAGMIGVPAAALSDTVEAYNAARAANTLEQLDVPRSQFVEPCAIATAPFMAISLVPGITYTMGGIAIDEHAQVLGGDGRPVPGLFAAGSATGGIEGGENAAYVGGLIKAGVFGLIAAERVAALEGKTTASFPNSSAVRAEAASAVASSRAGLAEFPVLRATLLYGRIAAVLMALFVAALALAIGWSAIGLLSLPLAALLGVCVGIAILSYTELVRLITELLMPE